MTHYLLRTSDSKTVLIGDQLTFLQPTSSLIYPGGIVLKREQNRKKPEERGLKKKNGFICSVQSRKKTKHRYHLYSNEDSFVKTKELRE